MSLCSVVYGESCYIFPLTEQTNKDKILRNMVLSFVYSLTVGLSEHMSAFGKVTKLIFVPLQSLCQTGVWQIQLDLLRSLFFAWSVGGASLLGSEGVARLSLGSVGKTSSASGCTAVGVHLFSGCVCGTACRLCYPPLPCSSCFPAFQYRFLGSKCPGQGVSCIPSNQV